MPLYVVTVEAEGAELIQVAGGRVVLGPFGIGAHLAGGPAGDGTGGDVQGFGERGGSDAPSFDVFREQLGDGEFSHG